MYQGLPKPIGLYHPRHERDACGIGFVADIEGRRSHQILKQAIRADRNSTHRGAVSADGKSGDGAGVLTQIPYTLFHDEMRGRGFTINRPTDLAVGMIFLPGDNDDARDACMRLVREKVEANGIDFICWRRVPLEKDALGEKALNTCPDIRQAMLGRQPGLRDDEFERLLYLTRRQIERAVHAEGIEEFYIPSFSHRTVSYKGLMIAPQLDHFYPDLADPRYQTAIAVFHQRYSTNTFPTWYLAQPFRFLAHNGEINTLQGNVNWMKAREAKLKSPVWGERIRELLPIVQEGGSDSAMLDNVLELITLSGRELPHAVVMMVPEAYQSDHEMDADMTAFFAYHALLSEPWDGPASLAMSDGRYAVAAMDRNGLRPARYWLTRDGVVIMGSEAGLVPVPRGEIVEKGSLGPGSMLAVDTVNRRLLKNGDIKQALAARKPYAEWTSRYLVKPHLLGLNGGNGSQEISTGDPDELLRAQTAFGYGKEDLDRILAPMVFEAREPVGSMGDDTPLSVLSRQPRLLYSYFKQRFAQVTNPPIDSLRERRVMSLATAVGPRGQLLLEEPESARLIKCESPFLTAEEFSWVRDQDHIPAAEISLLFEVAEGPEGMARQVDAICQQAEARVDQGSGLLILSDRGADQDRAAIPALLAVAAVHHHLIRVGKRRDTSLVVDSGEPREDHHYAVLIGYGASLIHPYLALRGVAALAERDSPEQAITVEDALKNYRAAVEKGILKIMSKMGISTVSSYRGAQTFEAIGIGPELIDKRFTGTISQIGGVEVEHLAQDVLRFHAEAYGEQAQLKDRGIYRYRRGQEYHSFNPDVFKALHKTMRADDGQPEFEQYADLVANRPLCNVRDLLEWRCADEPVPLDEVEPASEIVKRFSTQAMSHGALSRECHEVLAIAMNRIGGKSNSGEGGEDRVRFYPYQGDHVSNNDYIRSIAQEGDWGNSYIKQIASGRFGVTPEYLMSGREIEIKMAQGSKPGEGGQIPGVKVSEEIAAIRNSVPGVTLISPPPHHDIYSIEDLAQLIYDLKRINKDATVCVKLVAEAGVGTVAAGVAKGYADTVQISGHDGGTGASPLSSIKNAGLPWELGLAETQQTLVINDLRDRIKVRVDGGFKTGRDVVIAALLGAEEYGFGTAAMVAATCIMARQCHMNTCPVGVATQDPKLRARFSGTPEHVISFMMHVAEEVRQILARLGHRQLQDLIGRTDLLRQRETEDWPKAKLDLSALLVDPDPGGIKPRRHHGGRNDRPDDEPLDDILMRACEPTLEDPSQPLLLEFGIHNTDRTVGARLSGEIARKYRDVGLPQGTISVRFQGAAGQSFGAFLNRGIQFLLEGEAQDYVGKSLGGGIISIVPPKECAFDPSKQVIIGNTVMYGATSGALYAVGRAGQRLCVRNSGGMCVVEGAGDHGCEYMTNGAVVVLGETGRNFGAGMSGGIAFVLDEEGLFEGRFNPQMVGIQRVQPGVEEQLLHTMVQHHLAHTQSARAQAILDDWDRYLPQFWQVEPHPATEEATAQEQVVSEITAELLARLVTEPVPA